MTRKVVEDEMLAAARFQYAAGNAIAATKFKYAEHQGFLINVNL
jgi:hypothetical protein